MFDKVSLEQHHLHHSEVPLVEREQSVCLRCLESIICRVSFLFVLNMESLETYKSKTNLC